MAGSDAEAVPVKAKNKLTREARQKRGYGWKNWRKYVKGKSA